MRTTRTKTRLAAVALTLFVVMLAPVSGAIAQPKPPAKPPAAAAPSSPASPEDAKKDEARKLFTEGVAQVNGHQWAEALKTFEKAHELYPGANISFNTGVCERALGRYVRARTALQRALAENDAANGTALEEGSLTNAKAYLAEIESIIVRAKVTIRPVDATISVDGRPLAALDDKKTFAAGVAAPGPGEPAPAETFDLVLDPGNHVFVLARKGFSDQVSNRTLAGGKEVTDLLFELEKMQARISISSSVDNAIVRVGKLDVGAAPVDVLRPAGVYPVTVQKEGFIPYEASVSVKPGEEAKLNAVLKKKSFNVAEQWWFWTSIVAGLGTAAVVTYFVARPEPDPPPYNGGTTGWVVQPSAYGRFRF